MSDTSGESGKATARESQDGSGQSKREEAVRLLALAIDDANWARVRAQKRTHVVGVHGTDFEARDTRVEFIVEKFNERAVKTARKRALRAGWTKAQLAESGLDAEHGSGSAQV